MKKLYSLFAAALVAVCANAQDVVYDTLTVQSLNIDPTSGSYGTYNSQFASGAEYYACALCNKVGMDDGTIQQNIQLRGAKKATFSGIVVTKSAGRLAQIQFNWAANTTASRTVDVYACEAGMTDANWMHPDSLGRVDLVAADSIIYNADKELEFGGCGLQVVENGPEYFGICMHSTTAAYFSSIVIGWVSNTTAIDRVAVKNEQIFNLKGEAVKEMTAPGMYIVNGKKTFVR